MLGYGRQVIEEDDIAAVAAALRGDYLTTGPLVGQFEQALAREVGAVEAVVVNSGTAALHAAAHVAGISAGDVCVVPAMSFAATANAVRYVGGEVVFADVDADTGLMRLADLERAAEGKKIKAVFPVYLAGQTGEAGAIARWARERNVRVIEDACHVIGGTLIDADGVEKPVGAGANADAMSIFSFHPVKTITMGEGGAITTNSPELAHAMRRFRTHGITREANEFQHKAAAFDADGSANPWYGEQSELGFNYRATDISCALGLSQLAKLKRFVEHRAALRARYLERLKPLAPRVMPMPVRPHGKPAWHLMVALIDFAVIGQSRATLMGKLAARGIGSQVHYAPIPHHPYYRQRYGQIDVPGAERYYERCLSLPLYPSMNDADVDRVVEILADCI